MKAAGHACVGVMETWGRPTPSHRGALGGREGVTLAASRGCLLEEGRYGPWLIWAQSEWIEARGCVGLFVLLGSHRTCPVVVMPGAIFEARERREGRGIEGERHSTARPTAAPCVNHSPHDMVSESKGSGHKQTPASNKPKGKEEEEEDTKRKVPSTRFCSFLVLGLKWGTQSFFFYLSIFSRCLPVVPVEGRT